MLLDLWPLFDEEPSATPPTRGGGGNQLTLPTLRRYPTPQPAPIQRVRVRYEPARVTAKIIIPVRFAAGLGPAHINTRAAATPLYHPAAQAKILHEDLVHLTVRASLPDDDLEVLILAAAWE